MPATNTMAGQQHERQAAELLAHYLRTSDALVHSTADVAVVVEEIIKAVIAEIRPDIRVLYDEVHRLEAREKP